MSNIIRKLSRASYVGSIFYEWNIDGMSEHQIINLLHELMMAANAYRIKTSNSDFHVTGAWVIGFTGLLKGWWDHYLSQNDREYILNAKFQFNFALWYQRHVLLENRVVLRVRLVFNH